MYKGKRSYLEGPYHCCSRCGTRFHISDMEWQRGLLLCKQYCFDYGNDGFPLVGQREMAIAAVFEIPSNELMPDPKLTDTNEIEASMEDDIVY
jgi:predicted  nucleic acid-binding Zn-ribbon protein